MDRREVRRCPGNAKARIGADCAREQRPGSEESTCGPADADCGQGIHARPLLPRGQRHRGAPHGASRTFSGDRWCRQQQQHLRRTRQRCVFGGSWRQRTLSFGVDARRDARSPGRRAVERGTRVRAKDFRWWRWHQLRSGRLGRHESAVGQW